MFNYIFKYLQKRKPDAFVLENVPGLLTVNSGSCFRSILSALRGLRCYKVKWGILNACDYGAPQNRPRLFFVGILRSCYVGFSWPLESTSPSIVALADWTRP